MATKFIPTIDEFLKGHQIYEERESRDPMYKLASFLVKHFWGRPADVADSLGVLLLTWNQAFYRYGHFDFRRLERCITANQAGLDQFRTRNIRSYGAGDDATVTTLFHDFLDALQIVAGSKAGTKSPVAVAKALHLLAPDFFPLWDDKIARGYDCRYGRMPAAKYIEFMKVNRTFVQMLDGHPAIRVPAKPLLKLIDEYNYAKYTQRWI